MADSDSKPRVALLGAREADVEIFAELQRQDRVHLVAVYDPDPTAPGLALAEISGVRAGADTATRDCLANAEIIVLPTQRLAYQAAIDWCSGLRAELIGGAEARRRWGGAVSAAAAPPGDAVALTTRLAELEQSCARLEALDELGEWMLEACMRAIGATGGSLQLVAAQTEELYLLAARGLSEDVMRHARHPLGEPISGLAAVMRTAQLLHGEQAGRVSTQRGAVSSAVCVPLLTSNGVLVGVLNVSSTVPGRRFDNEDLEDLSQAAPRMAALLEHARRSIPITTPPQATFMATLADLGAKTPDPATAFMTLTREICRLFDAESANMYMATDEGEWLQLASHAGTTPASPASRALASRAFLQREWVHVAEQESSSFAPGTDLIAAAVERALSPVGTDPLRSSVYVPLVGTVPVGVLRVVFTRLATAEAFTLHGPSVVGQLALYVEARIRQRQLEARLGRSARLTRVMPQLQEAAAQGALDPYLVREAALLLGAERAMLRHVDEARRTYSRPITHGIPDTSAESWRTVDARITESTLQNRHADLRTTQSVASERLDQAPRTRSFVSVPIQQQDRIVAVLNVYDKLPHDPLEGTAFSPFDRDLLESLGSVAAALWLQPAAPERPALAAETALQPSISSEIVAPAPPEQLPVLDIESKRLREELHREIARAQRHQRQLGIALLHVQGLDRLVADERDRMAAQIDGLLRDYVRSSDLVGWYGPDRVMIVSPEADASGHELETRVRALLAEKLPLSAAMRLVVRLGTSSYPNDGDDASLLLQAAVARLS